MSLLLQPRGSEELLDEKEYEGRTHFWSRTHTLHVNQKPVLGNTYALQHADAPAVRSGGHVLSQAEGEAEPTVPGPKSGPVLMGRWRSVLDRTRPL